MLVDRSVRELLDAFGSSDPTPGGGSASALASAAGASLLVMVASLPKTRSGSEQDAAALATAAQALSGARAELTGAIDADTEAYDRVVAAYKLPKSSADEQASRTDAIQRALKGATDVPLAVMRLSAAALEQAAAIAAHGHRGAASDVGTAVALLRAGLTGARLNVEINLGGIRDEAYVADARADAQRVARQGAASADAADASAAGNSLDA
jgi:formiminotetrahydrofolate cyclodeaminase